MNKWKIKGEVYNFPRSWSIDDVVRFVNTDLKVCPICWKVDVGINHFNKH